MVTDSDYDPRGNITKLTRTAGGGSNDTETFTFQYNPAAYMSVGNGNLVPSNEAEQLHQVTIARGSLQVEKATYTYYQGSSHGCAGDLEQVDISQIPGQGGAPLVVVNGSYYQYNAEDLLKYVVSGDDFVRALAAAASTTPDALGSIENYADGVFGYADNRVSTQTIKGTGASSIGSLGAGGQYGYVYGNNKTTSGTIGINVWKQKATVRGPNGNPTVVYTNYAAEPMLTSAHDTSSLTGTSWNTFTQYDSSGRVCLIASPSALLSPTEDMPQLAELGELSQGLITHFDYYGNGDTAQGFLKDSYLEQGSVATTEALQTAFTYTRIATINDGSGNNTTVPIFRVHESSVFVNSTMDASDPGAETTSYAYGGSGLAVTSITTSLPRISTTQHGTNSADTMIMNLDSRGRIASVQDATGKVTSYQYDDPTGATRQVIADVGGLALTTSMLVDALGRVTRLTDPAGHITTKQYYDTLQDVRVLTDLQWSGAGTASPDELDNVNRLDGYTETLTLAYGSIYTPDGPDIMINNGLRGWVRSYVDNAGRTVATDRWFDLHGTLWMNNSRGTKLEGGNNDNGNYTETQYAYDASGRQYKVTDAVGTVTETLYDGLGRVIGTEVGKASDAKSMTQVTKVEYDGGRVGDGDITRYTAYVSSPAAEGHDASTDRVTINVYDWRDRLTTSDTGRLRITYAVFDNLGEAIENYVYDGEGISTDDLAGWSKASHTDKLRSATRTYFDARGRVYQTNIYAVDQTAGGMPTETAAHLTNAMWYDVSGRLIATSAPGGLWTKTVYDSLGRVKATYTTDGYGGNPAGVVGDYVLSEQKYDYDADGNVKLVTDSERFHNTSGVGELDSVTNSRTSYVASYYDAANRLTDTVNVGDYGGSIYTRPLTPDARSATVLRTTYTYNSAGLTYTITDPRGIVTTQQYDAAGRVTRVITTSPGTGLTPNAIRTTTTTYDGLDRTLTTFTANAAPVLSAAAGPATPVPNPSTTYAYFIGVASRNAVQSVTTTTWISDKTPRPETESYTYNLLGQALTDTQKNGVVHTYTYDTLGRMTSDLADVTKANVTVDQSVLQITYGYDALSRMTTVKSWGQEDPAHNDYAWVTKSVVTRAYNAFGQVTQEQDSFFNVTNTTTYSYDLCNNHSRLSMITYPDAWKLRYEYSTLSGDVSGLDDRISRVSFLAEDNNGAVGNHLEEYRYLGLSEVVERGLPIAAGTLMLDYVQLPGQATGDGGDQYTGLDRFGRVVDVRWTLNGTNNLENDQYGYDQDSNVLYRQNLLAPSLSELYSQGDLGIFGAFNLPTGFERGTLVFDGSTVGIRNVDTTTEAKYYWDLAGNLCAVGSFGTDGRLQTPVTALSQSYDAGGTYDAWGRLTHTSANVKVSGQTYTSTVDYQYDGLNRRYYVSELISNSGSYYTDSRQLVYSIAGQVIQDVRTTDAHYGSSDTWVTNLLTRYVWSAGQAGALVLRDQEQTPGSRNGVMNRLFALTDMNDNVTGVLTGIGDVEERYLYSNLGQLLEVRYGSNWAPKPFYTDDLSNINFDGSTLGWDVLYHGTRREGARGTYDAGTSDYDPSRGHVLTPQRPVGWGEWLGDQWAHTSGWDIARYIASPPGFLAQAGMNWVGGKLSGWGQSLISDSAGNGWGDWAELGLGTALTFESGCANTIGGIVNPVGSIMDLGYNSYRVADRVHGATASWAGTLGSWALGTFAASAYFQGSLWGGTQRAEALFGQDFASGDSLTWWERGGRYSAGVAAGASVMAMVCGLAGVNPALGETVSARPTYRLPTSAAAAERAGVFGAGETFIGGEAADGFLTSIQRVPGRPGWHTIRSHGFGGELRELVAGEWRDVPLEDVVQRMAANGYEIGSGQPVQILGCYVAEGGEASIAARLSTRLGGATVEATPYALNVDSLGGMSVYYSHMGPGARIEVTTGAWVRFPTKG